MDTFFVALIVIAAVIILLSSFVKAFRAGGEGTCGCGTPCSGCSAAADCGSKPERKDSTG